MPSTLDHSVASWRSARLRGNDEQCK
jgi:hypothetical protein